MNPYAKTAIKCAVLTLWSATITVGVLLAYEQLRPPIEQTDLDAVEQKINQVLLESAATQTAALNVISNKLLNLEAEFTSLDQRYSGLANRQQSHEGALSNLDARLRDDMTHNLETLETRLTAKLNKAQARPTRSVINEPRKAVSTRQPKALLTAPFELYDVQKRGLTYLAIVGKPGATHLSQLHAIQEGQSYLSWRLIKVEPGRVELQKATDRIELEVRS
ncbi:hypothetical protein DZ860_16835 [Vibrio sinensis]|uniref:Uncharacterized protein n=1 Tax=Vibrio sinensis TaxID=2302434 RepID=A0A3A6QBG6_9VIBR|nr:hypothetical protein [Vibrio sinensis]RJX68659.1 hypothetical protein DZ860_16835 [Vibrio sinensis]